MSGFLDLYLPEQIAGYTWTSSPRTSTTITQVASNAEHRNKNWKFPLRQFKCDEGVRCHEDIENLLDHWIICDGPYHTFAMRDPADFASTRLRKFGGVPDIVSTDQLIGIGDGFTRTFQLQKTYTRGSFTRSRTIHLPIVESVLVAIDGFSPDTGPPDLVSGPYDVAIQREGGLLTFTPAPALGVVITAGFYFDCNVRFMADDSFDQVSQAFQTDGFAELDFQEVRWCGDNESEGS